MRARIEVVVAVLLSACAIALHVVFFRCAGALWRDEASSLHAADGPWHELWARLHFESFPLLWPFLLRSWTSLSGEHLASLRLFGVLTGLLVGGAIWIAARAFDVRTPVVALAIAALSGGVVRWGDSIRGYGWSIIAGLLCIAAMQRATISRRWLLAGLIAVISVHATFFNSVVVLAACVAAAVVTRDFVKPILIGIVAAASLLIYVPMMRQRAAWTSVEALGIDVRWIANRAFAALATSGAITAWLAIATIVIAVVLAPKAPHHRFAMIVLFVSIAGTLAFLMVLKYAPEPWYFVLLIAVIALCADVLLAGTALRVIAALLISACALPFAIRYVSQRATNVVDVAAAVNALRKPGDVVIVYPWYCGASFAPHAKAPWTTLPPLADHNVQRYDLLFPQLGHGEAATPVVDAATHALQSGHVVWLAGFPLGSESAGTLDDPRTATLANRSDAMWSAALREALRANAHQATLVVPPDPQTSPFERMQLIAFRR